jgi:hypothetical protein
MFVALYPFGYFLLQFGGGTTLEGSPLYLPYLLLSEDHDMSESSNVNV